MDVKIGMQDVSRELVLTTTASSDDVDELVATAFGSQDGLLRISDEKGRKFVVPVAKIAYVELGPADSRRVGFS